MTSYLCICNVPPIEIFVLSLQAEKFPSLEIFSTVVIYFSEPCSLATITTSRDPFPSPSPGACPVLSPNYLGEECHSSSLRALAFLFRILMPGTGPSKEHKPKQRPRAAVQ